MSSTEADDSRSNVKDGFILSLKFIMPKVALIVLVTLYAVAGGFIFQHLESTNEKQECFERASKYEPVVNETVDQIWNTITSYRNLGDKEASIEAFHNQLSTFRDRTLSISYDGTNCSTLGEVNGTSMQWSLPGSVLFSITVFTTVGYGNIAPKTQWGRMVCIAYAILGIPLMLVALASIGEIMANIFRYTYLNVCCCGILKFCHKKDDLPPTQQQQQQLHIMDTDDDSSQVVMMAEDEDDLDKLSVPLTVTLFLLGSYLFLGALLFAVWIELSWMDAAYFSFVTFSTIGFGDIVPDTGIQDTNSQFKIVGTAIYMVIGMATLSMAFNLMQEEVVEKLNWLGEKVKSLKKEDRVKND